jgi:hypothetical protein
MKRKKYINSARVFLFLFGVSIIQTTLAQNYAEYSIKEKYDILYQTKVQNGNLNAGEMNNNSNNIAGTFGDSYCYILESNLNMYEATRDKAYLIKFIIGAIDVMEHRRDIIGIDPDQPKWGADNIENTGYPSAYHDGNILRSLCRFVYLVHVQEPQLEVIPLPQIANINNNFFSINFGQTFLTYGDFANWLSLKADETIVYYLYGSNNHWYDNIYCLIKKPDIPVYDFPHYASDEKPMEVNKQAGFGAALFYLGTSHPNTDYINKSRTMAGRFKGYRNDQADCNQNTQGGYTATTPVIEYMAGTDSYKWMGCGWRPQSCEQQEDTDNGVEGAEDYEDISHLVQTLTFPMTIYDELVDGGNNLYFAGNDEMLKIRNAFTRNIFAGYNVSGCPDFHAGMDGDDIIFYRPAYSGLNTLSFAALNLIALYKFDQFGTSPNAYDISMDYYGCAIDNDIFAEFTQGGGMYIAGVSEVVKAQWDMECVNLTLYNRDLIYDQDFIVKNKLIIDPLASQAESFADPIINSPDFIIEPNTTVNLVAGEYIQLKSNVSILSGSSFHAFIEVSNCTDGRNMESKSKSSLAIDEGISSQTHPNNIGSAENYSIFPNPNGGMYSLSIQSFFPRSTTLQVLDMTGKILLSQTLNLIEGANLIPIDQSGLLSGIYFVHVDGFTETIKMIVTR